MAITGLDIYKHLPKTNCKECGLATCLAFAMKVASGQTTLGQCPHLDESARGALDEASAPPQQLVKIGAGEESFEIGRETVLYRHEEKFHHPSVLAVIVEDTLDAGEIEARCREIEALKFERMGTVLEVGMIAVCNTSGEEASFVEAVRVASNLTGKPLALVSACADRLYSAAEGIKDKRPLLWAMDPTAESSTTDPACFDVAKDLGLPLCITAPGFDALAGCAEAARAAGLKDLVLSPGKMAGAEALEFLSQSRRAGITKKFRPMGYPIAMPVASPDPTQAAVEAAWYVLRYAGIVLVSTIAPEDILAILSTRQDIYTDPQVPVQVMAGIHEVGTPGPGSPLLVTTNFALSYYSVESEVESSRVASYVLAVDTEGTSVLTAWAADKFNAETITAAINASDIGSKLNHKKIIIPGHVAVLSATINDESGYEVLVGPKEASGLVSYLKTQWKS